MRVDSSVKYNVGMQEEENDETDIRHECKRQNPWTNVEGCRSQSWLKFHDPEK